MNYYRYSIPSKHTSTSKLTQPQPHANALKNNFTNATNSHSITKNKKELSPFIIKRQDFSTNDGTP